MEKISAWNLRKVRSKKEVIDEARTKGAKVHVASLMDICHLKNAELETKHQKYKGRVVLRGDIVKDDSGSYEVFTEQGSSASQVTAANVMDIISILHTSTPRRSETNGIAEKAVRRIEEGTSAVLLQFRLDDKMVAVSMECYFFCETFKTSYRMGKHFMKGDLENHSKDQ